MTAKNSSSSPASFTLALALEWVSASTRASCLRSLPFSTAGSPASHRTYLPLFSVVAATLPQIMRLPGTPNGACARLILILSVLFAALFMAAPRCPAQEEVPAAPLPVFEFHSGFWLNLHHTLYRQARLQRSSASGANAVTATAGMNNLSPAEARAWNSALAFYGKAYADKDLTVSLEMILIKNQLGDFETCEDLSGTKKKTCDAGLPALLTQTLESAAPVYRAHLWTEHDRSNRRWIAAVAPLVRRSGLDLSHRLSEIYQTPWPRERIRVDVTSFASSTGAYTTLDPLRVTASATDARNQGAEALEVLFHEASHGIADVVQDAIFRECRQRDKPIPRDLWHALLFYTTGEVIRPLASSSTSLLSSSASGDSSGSSSAASPSSGYVPYAVREGLYKRGWENYLRILTQYWQPYLDGRVDFSDAVAHMVSAL